MQWWVRSGHRNHQRNSDDTIAWKVFLSTSGFYQPTNRNCARLPLGKTRTAWKDCVTLPGIGIPDNNSGWLVRRDGSKVPLGLCEMVRWASNKPWIAEFSRFLGGPGNAHVLHGKLENSCHAEGQIWIFISVSCRTGQIRDSEKDVRNFIPVVNVKVKTHFCIFSIVFRLLFISLGHKIRIYNIVRRRILIIVIQNVKKKELIIIILLK